MDIGTDVEVRIAPEAQPIEALDGRYWLHDDALYAEINRANKRFYLVDDVNVEALAHHVRRVLSYRASVPTSVTMKWCPECPYDAEDEFWTGWLEHSATLRFQNFLQRRAAAREVTRATSAAALRERLEKERSEQELQRQKGERESSLAWHRQRQSANHERLVKLAHAVRLSNPDHVRSPQVIAWIKTLPIPDDVHAYGGVLDERQRVLLIGISNGIRLKDLAALYDVAPGYVGQIRDKALFKIEQEKRRENPVEPKPAQASLMRVPKLSEVPVPRLQMNAGPLMEWTAEMQAAEIAAERG